MKARRVLLGFIFICIGIAFYLQKAGVIHISAGSAWPFLFIIMSAGFHVYKQATSRLNTSILLPFQNNTGSPAQETYRPVRAVPPGQAFFSQK